MSKRIVVFKVMISVLVMLTIIVLSSACQQDSTIELETPDLSNQEEHEVRKETLVLQFQDNFNEAYGPPDYFDMTKWSRLRDAHARIEDGYWLMDAFRSPPPGPGEGVMGGFSTVKKIFNPRLAGTIGVELTLEDFVHEKDYPKEMEEFGQLVHAWSLTVASWQGQVGMQDENQRGIQLHFDLHRDEGLFVYLVRGIVPEDYEKYPMDGFGKKTTPKLSPRELRELHEKEIAHGGVFISKPCVILASRVYRTEQEIQGVLGRGHRWGLYLTNDANTVYWTLDNQVMDTADISGYFHSAPDSVQDGAFLTIMGLGTYQQNTWKMDDLEIFGSP